MADEDGIAWDAPGPGYWTYDPAHFPRTTTGFSQRTGMPGASEGFAAGFARYGHPTVGVSRGVVNGWMFGQRTPISPDMFAERERAAREAMERRLWRVDGQRWYGSERAEIFATCRALQDVDVAALDDDSLSSHLFDVLELLRQTQVLHFSHVAMVIVVGRWLLAAEEWGISRSEALGLLAGASPATAAAGVELGRIGAALTAAGVPVTDVTSLDDIRRASSDAANALDEYLDTYGWRTVSGFDIDALALIEMPDVVVATVRAAMKAPHEPRPPDVDRVRSRVPADDHQSFDELLEDARYVYGIRDDDVGPCMWARGLTRRALLESGSRFVIRGRLRSRDDVLEAGAHEVAAMLGGSSEPSEPELAARAELRRHQARLTPPPALGTPPPQPTLPPTVARVHRAMTAYMGSAPPQAADDGALTGIGIGDRAYSGRARVVDRADDALATLEPGDVLVTPMTTPAFNSVLAIAGALVVEFGGPTSHAGIMARELGLPAVVEARGCMQSIPDGARIEVDPLNSRVRIV